MGVIGLHPLHFPPFVKECVSPPNTFSWPHGPLHSTFSHEPNVRVVTLMVVGCRTLSTIIHTYSKNKQQIVNYLELSDTDNEEDLENELNPKAEAYQAWYEKNKRDRTREHVRQHQLQKIAHLEEAMIQDAQVFNSKVMASKSLHTFKCQT